MTDIVKIAVDAMGGDKSPKKILDGIEISLKKIKENYFYVFGYEDKIKNELIRLQDEQCKIYESDFKRVCIDGGPGTGKSVVAQYIASILLVYS